MRAAVLQVTLGILTLLLAFCKAQANENKTGDEQQYDVVLPYSCEEEVAMIESLLEDIGQKAREKDSAVLEMQEKFEQAQHSKEEQFNVTLAQRDKDISELQAKLVESEELLKIVPPLSVTLAQRDKDISELQAKLVESEELLNAMEAQLQPKESEIMELKHKSLDMESALGTLEDTMADLDTSLDILDALRDILMVDDDEKIVGRVKEILLASRVPLYEEKSDDHAGDSVPGEGSKAPPSEEVLEGQDELQRVKQELIDVKRWSSDEISHIESREHAFFFNVSELVHEMVACRTGEKDMGVLEGYREKTLDVLQKLSEEVKACHDIPDSLQTRHAEGEEEGTETKMGHDYECRNVSDYLMRDLTTCKEEVVSLSECIVSLKDENRVLLERPSEFLLNQTESLLSGLEALKVEHNEESQEVGENSMEVETRKRAAEIVKQLHDALIVGQKLAGLNSNLIATPLVEDVQDMEESSYSDKGIHAEPNEEERGRQEQIEMEVDFKGHISNETDSLLYRLAELEEELVACREKAELQNVHEDHPDIPHVEDEVVVTCANASVEDELYKPGKKTYTSPTPDYNSLSTFIDDALTIGASLASRVYETLACVGPIIVAPIFHRFSTLQSIRNRLLTVILPALKIFQSAMNDLLSRISPKVVLCLQRVTMKMECYYKDMYESMTLKLLTFPVLEKDERAFRITKFFFIIFWSMVLTIMTRFIFVVTVFVIKTCLFIGTLLFRAIAIPYILLKRILKPNDDDSTMKMKVE